MICLLCVAVPVFSMERAKKIVRQVRGKPEYTKDIFQAPQGAEDAPLGDALKHLGKGRPKSKL